MPPFNGCHGSTNASQHDAPHHGMMHRITA